MINQILFLIKRRLLRWIFYLASLILKVILFEVCSKIKIFLDYLMFNKIFLLPQTVENIESMKIILDDLIFKLSFNLRNYELYIQERCIQTFSLRRSKIKKLQKIFNKQDRLNRK